MDDKIYLEIDDTPTIQVFNPTKEVFRITAEGVPMLGPDATVDEAAKGLVDALANGMHKYITEIKTENERLREALSAIALSHNNTVPPEGLNAEMMWIGCVQIARSALQQKDSE